jgi:hypothetical protein
VVRFNKVIKKVTKTLCLFIIISLITWGFSNIYAENNNSSDKGTRHSGDILEAQFGSIVTIDGIISDYEWSDANFIEIDTDLFIITVYFKHDKISLVIGFDIPEKTYHPDDKVDIGLDINNDGEYNGNDCIIMYERNGNIVMYEAPEYRSIDEPHGFKVGYLLRY